jgi:hypothetical protein
MSPFHTDKVTSTRLTTFIIMGYDFSITKPTLQPEYAMIKTSFHRFLQTIVNCKLDAYYVHALVLKP